MLDLDAVSDRHDRAVLVERKAVDGGRMLGRRDLAELFACCSDIPDLLAEISRLQAAIESMTPVVEAARAVVAADLVLLTSEYPTTQEKADQAIFDALELAVGELDD